MLSCQTLKLSLTERLDDENKLGQRQSQTPFSSAFLIQKSVGSNKGLIQKNFLGPVIT